MNLSRFSMASRVGAIAACVHLVAFIVTLLQIARSSDGQASLAWMKWWWLVVDFPFTLLHLVSREAYSNWLNTLGGVFGQMLYLPHLIHGVFGTIWWYFLPRVFLPKRLGGLWVAHNGAVPSTHG
jgi:hypothetical protein